MSNVRQPRDSLSPLLENVLNTQPAPLEPLIDASAPVTKPPKALLMLLGIYFLLEVLSVLAGEVVAVARIIVIGIAAWRTLQGSRPASFFLGGLFVIGALLCLRETFVLWSLSPPYSVGAFVAAWFCGAVASYVFLSPAMKALYVQGDRDHWRGR